MFKNLRRDTLVLLRSKQLHPGERTLIVMHGCSRNSSEDGLGDGEGMPTTQAIPQVILHCLLFQSNSSGVLMKSTYSKIHGFKCQSVKLGIIKPI